MIPLSPLTLRCVRRVFFAADAPVANRQLEENCADTFHWPQPDPVTLDRPRIVAVKLSRGDLNALARAIQLAHTDWRDLLVCAGFTESVTAHKHWMPP